MSTRVNLLIFLLQFSTCLSAAELQLLPGQSSPRILGEYVSFNRELPPDALFPELIAAEFQPLGQGVPNFGIGTGPIWLRITLVNSSSEQGSWVFSLNRALLHQLRVVLQTQTDIREIMTLEDRITSYRSFGTLAVPFDLGPERSANVFVLYEGANSSVLPISIETFESAQDARLFKLILFYGSLAGVLTLVVYNTVLALITRMRAFIYYGAAQLSLLAYFTHLSGITTVYLFPETPELGNTLAPLLAIVTCLFSLLFVRSFVDQAYLTAWVTRVFNIIIIICLCYLALSIFGLVLSTTIPLLPTIATAISTATIIMLPVSGLLACRKRRYRFLPMAVAWFWFSFSMSYTTLSILNLVPVTPSFMESYMAFAFVEAILLSVSLALTVRHIEHTRVTARESLAKSLASELQESRRAELLARERSMALDDLADRGRLLQAAGHDTRQTLFALRQFATGLNPQEPPARIHTARNAINQLVNHLDDVLATTLAGAHGGAMIDDILALEKVSVSDLFEPIRLIYQRMAAKKGLRLIITRTTASLVTDRVLMIRILSNLVGNAVKYTDAGGVLVGCRVRKSGLRLQVWDTGQGLTAEQLAILTRYDPHAHRFTHLEEGMGRGIQICRELASKLGIELTATSTPGRGSLFECVIGSSVTTARTPKVCYLLDEDPLMRRWLTEAGVGVIHPLPDSDTLPLFIDYDYQGSGNGLTIARELSSAFPNLILTSYDHGADVRNAAAGIVRYIAYKPLDSATTKTIFCRAAEYPDSHGS